MEDSLFNEDLISSVENSQCKVSEDSSLSQDLRLVYRNLIEIFSKIRRGGYSNIVGNSLLSELLASNLINAISPLINYIYRIDKDGK